MRIANLFIPYLEPDEFARIAPLIADVSDDRELCRQIPLGTETAVVACILVEKQECAEWGRRVSAESGGFCVAQPDVDTPPAVFYSGEPLESSADDTWEDWYQTLCGIAWNPRLAAIPDIARLRVRSAAPKFVADGHWTRAAFASVEGSEFRRAVEEAGAAGLAIQGWRYLERKSSLATLPFIVMECRGACDVALLQFFAKRLDANAAALEFRPGAPILGWWLDASGVLDSGEASLASDVADFCTSLCITMGEAAGQFRWPHREPGRPLTPIAARSQGIAR